ncbi:hypothetical protein [Rosistilla oblonga]|uniref:Uncharacterized protein n=1 Tax=Rosistilla oblonga TaxID=2527990 RepID=A0A518IQ93_9BACT|nr:hypothetical protein [Rosistilla oblonga]QDV55257.1 hypothetical protein Mal33_12270 [Rosistilla oblonga]
MKSFQQTISMSSSLRSSKWNCLYAIQLATLAAMLAWTVFDPQFEPLVDALRRGSDSPIAALRSANVMFGAWRPSLFFVVIGLACVSLVGLFLGMLKGTVASRPVRSLRSLLMLTAVVALWCGLVTNHASLAWQGKRLRLVARVAELETIARPLRSDWPKEDGELPRIGPFMAYPFGDPTTMILLAPPTVSGGEICIAAIERCDDGAIKLQLGGSKAADWVEWHPESSEPESFVGGLQDSHHLRSHLRLGSGWFLVRYDA